MGCEKESEELNLGELASRLKDYHFSLFVGAGVSMNAGGPNGKVLLDNIKSHFGIKEESPFFDIMDRIVGDDDMKRRDLEQFVYDSLRHIHVTDLNRYLLSLPWRAVLTTNYDDIPEMVEKTLDESRTIKVIVHKKEEIDLEKKSLLYYMKIFGDMKIRYDEPGCMVLTNEDRRVANFQHEIYNLFAEVSSAGHVVYIGHSFEDNFVLEVLREISRTTKKHLWPGYAISPSRPKQDVYEKLKRCGIEWIQGDLDQFVTECKKVYGAIPNSTFLQKTPLLVHNKLITLGQEVESNIDGKYYYLNQSMLNYRSTPVDFISGSDKYFEPFRKKWDYSRRFKIHDLEENKHDVIDSHTFVNSRIHLDFSKNKIFSLIGGPASGKTVAVKRIAFDWYTTGNPVIFLKNSYNVDKNALRDLLEEMRMKYHSMFSEDAPGIIPMRYLLIIENARPYLNEIIELQKYLTSLAKPIDFLIVERRSALTIEGAREFGFNAVLELDDTIQEEELDDFIKHFYDLHILSDRQVIMSNLKDKDINSSFFALLYTSVSNIQKSLRDSVIGEYEVLSAKAQKIYSITSVLRAYEQKAYTPMIARASEIDDITIMNMFEKELKGILLLDKYHNTILINHRIVAEIIADNAFPTKIELKNVLIQLIKSVNVNETNQLDILHDMLIRRVAEEQRFRILSFEDKEELFRIALSIIESGLLLHHLARLYLKNNKLDKCESYLKRSYEPYEIRKRESTSYIRDTQGRLELERAKIARLQGHKELSNDHLHNAEETFLTIRNEDGAANTHAYHGLGEVYFRKAELTDSYPDKSNLLALAISSCGTYKSVTGDVNNDFINDLQRNIFSEMEKLGFDEKIAKNIAAENKNAEGYAYLAERKIEEKDYNQALRLVNEGLSFDKSSAWLNGLRVFCIRKLWPGDNKTLGDALLSWEKAATKPFNIGLTFELAKFKFMNGQEEQGLKLFKELTYKTFSHPSRLVIDWDKDTWLQENVPRTFEGLIDIVPKTDRLGEIRCTSESSIRRNIPVPAKAVKYDKPRKFDRVSFHISFNYLGPIAFDVRQI